MNVTKKYKKRVLIVALILILTPFSSDLRKLKTCLQEISPICLALLSHRHAVLNHEPSIQ